MSQTKDVEKFKTHVMVNNSFPKSVLLYDIMEKNKVERDRKQMIIQNGACASHAG